MASTSGQAHLEAGSFGGSFSPLLNRQVLYVKDIDITCPKQELEALLLQLCPLQLGNIKVPVNYQTGNILGYAYLNFWTLEDAARVLDEWRFSFYVNGRPVKMLYAMAAREALDIIFGPQGQSHIVFVKNLSPEVQPAHLFERFKEHGEIFTCEVNVDQYGQSYGIIHYMEEESLPVAVQAEDRSFFFNTIINVTAHYAYKGPMLPANPTSTSLALQSDADFPTLGGAPAASALHSQTGNEGSSYQHDHPASTSYDAQSQQQVQQLGHLRTTASSQYYYDSPTSTSSAHGVPATNGGTMAANLQQPMAAASTGRSAMHPLFDRLVQSHRGTASTLMPNSTIGTAANTTSIAGIPVPQPVSILVPVPVPAPVSKQPAAQLPVQRKADGNSQGTGSSAKSTKQGAAIPKQSMQQLMKAVLSKLEHMTDMLCCPITQEPFKDPVVAADGHCYERSAIEAWLAKSDMSPLTNMEMAHKNLLPNTLVKHLCEDFSG